MGRQVKKVNNIIRLILSIIFLFTQLGIDIRPVHSAMPQILPLPNPSEITIPEAYGKVTEAFKGDSDKLVFHIQDLHTNPEAQLNASKIMEYLIDTYGIKLLTIEGEAGHIDPEWLANVSLIKIINDKMAEIFLNSGEMTGEEYLYVTRYPKYKDVVFRGIEDKDSYWKNREVFNRMYPRIRENMRLCDNIKGSLDRLKKAIYPEAAVELDEKRASYEARELEVKDYTSYLIGIAKEKDIDLSKYENFSILAKLVEIQERLEFSKVDKERSLLFDGLSKALSEEQAKAMMEKVKEHNEGKLTAIEFYTYLKELATNNDIDFTQYPNIITYMEYISTSDKLDNTHLFKELEQVEDAITETYLTTDEQKQLARLSKNLSIMKKFFDINLSNEDLDYYQKNKDEFKVQAFVDFIKEKAKQHDVRISTDPSLSQLDKTLVEQDEFYKVVLVRDEAMVKNTLKRMEEFNANITIQPIGGFHTKGMAKMYKEQGISYVVISPHVTKEFDEENYRNILQNKKKPVKELIEEFSKTLRPDEFSSKRDAGAQADAVAAAVYIARDIFEKQGMTEEEALRAALGTVNPKFLEENTGKLPEDLKGIAVALKDEAPEINFEQLTPAEKDYWKSIGIQSFDDVLFITGLGFAGLAIFDGVRKKVLVHRWWGLAGIAYRKFAAGEDKSRKIDLLISRSITDHDYEHVKDPTASEEQVYNKQAETLLALGGQGRQVANDMAEGLEELNGVKLGTQSYPGVYAANTARYIAYLKAVSRDFEGADREKVISEVAEASETIAGLYASQQMGKKLDAALSTVSPEAIAKAVIEGDAFAGVAKRQNVQIPVEVGAITFDVATLLGEKGPRDLAGIGAIADKLQGKTIFIVNTYGDIISDAEIEGLLGLRGSSIKYEIIAEKNIAKASSAQQFVILKRNLGKFESIVEGKKPIIIDLSEAQEGETPPAVVSVYSILLALGLVFDAEVLGDLLKYITQGAAGDNYSAVIGVQPAQTFGEQYQKFLLERIQR